MFEIIGYEMINFTNKETGEIVEGYKLHLISEAMDKPNAEGKSVLSKFFSKKYIKGSPVKVGAFCDFIIAIDSKGVPQVKGINII